jgi:hypothetical protein
LGLRKGRGYDKPGEYDPQSESDDNRLCEEHSYSLDSIFMQQILHAFIVEVHLTLVTLIACLFSWCPGTFLERLAATSFLETEQHKYEQWNVSKPLNALNPPPSNRLIYEACVYRCSDGAEDSNIGEEGYELCTFILYHQNQYTFLFYTEAVWQISGTNRSEKVPPTKIVPTDLKIPNSNLITMIVAMLLPRANPRRQRVKQAYVPTYTTFLPAISQKAMRVHMQS